MKTSDEERHRKEKTRRSATRRWCVPPAITREPGENVEFIFVLDEHPHDRGLLLWQALRDVTLFASVEPEKRGGLFKPAAAEARLKGIGESGLEVRVAMDLTTLTAIVATPEQVSGELVGMVCMDLSRWAEDRTAFATAVAFAQAAAMVEPEAPRPSARVGHLALRWGRSARAETWLRRGIGLARRAKDWNTYGYAYVALASIYAERGQRSSAKRFSIQAVRVGRRNGLHAIRGAALHGLLRLAMADGEFADAKKHAHSAARALGRGHPALPDLMLDIAQLMVLTGEYERAANHLRKLLVGVADPARRARILAVLARAAAGVATTSGSKTASEVTARETYRQAWSEAWMLITAPGASRDSTPATLLELARAAATLRDNPRLEQAARLDRDAVPTCRGAPAAAQSAALRELVQEMLQGSRDG